MLLCRVSTCTRCSTKPCPTSNRHPQPVILLLTSVHNTRLYIHSATPFRAQPKPTPSSFAPHAVVGLQCNAMQCMQCNACNACNAMQCLKCCTCNARCQACYKHGSKPFTAQPVATPTSFCATCHAVPAMHAAMLSWQCTLPSLLQTRHQALQSTHPQACNRATCHAVLAMHAAKFS